MRYGPFLISCSRTGPQKCLIQTSTFCIFCNSFRKSRNKSLQAPSLLRPRKGIMVQEADFIGEHRRCCQRWIFLCLTVLLFSPSCPTSSLEFLSLLLPISLLDSTTCYYRSTYLSAVCLSIPLNLNLQHSGVSGKIKSF